MKQYGYAPLEKNRGLQVKQLIKCLKHKTEFLGYPYFILNGSKVFACEKCGKEHIDNTDAAGLNYWKFPNLLKYALHNHGRYKHKILKIETDTKRVTLLCHSSHKIFTTNKILAEFRQGKTECFHCSNETKKLKFLKIKQKNTIYYNKNYENKYYSYSVEGKVCKIHGLLKKGTTKCYSCFPAKYVSPFKNMNKDKRKNFLHNFSVNKKKLEERSRVTSLFLKLYPKLDNIKLSKLPKSRTEWLFINNNEKLVFHSITGKLRGINEKFGHTSKNLELHLLNEGIQMAKRLTLNDILFRIEQKFKGKIKVLRTKTIEKTNTSSRKILLELKHTFCGSVWKTYSYKLFQTKYGCPKCASKMAGRTNSHKMAPLEKYRKILENRVPHMKILKKIKSEIKTSTAYNFVVECKRCNTKMNLSGRDIRTIHSCISCNPKLGNSSRSRICQSWLIELEKFYGITIQGCNSKEKLIRSAEKIYRVDGFHKESNTIFEFLGDYWHGNPDSSFYNKEKYNKTFSRLICLHKKYNIVYVWESDYLAGLPHSGFLGRNPILFL